MVKFRFQDLQIWRESIIIADELFDIADELEKDKLFRFSEQLRVAAMSISNNIAEGSGSNSSKEYKYLRLSQILCKWKSYHSIKGANLFSKIIENWEKINAQSRIGIVHFLAISL